MPSVVIPAYNEENGIGRCLRSVLADRIDGLAVVVVANGCRDQTASRAREVTVPEGARVIVVETPVGGKTRALDLGEATLRESGLDSFPRLFLDGDIELAPGSLAALLAAAESDRPLVRAATPRFDTRGASIAVRLFYAAERFNPYHLEGAPNGSGTYCVSRAGRARWDSFPEVIADDGFVERCFTAGERATVGGALATVRVPRTLRALRGIAARKRLGTQELEVLPARDPGAGADRGPRGGSGSTLRAVARSILGRPWLLPALLVWIGVKLLERAESRAVAASAGESRWRHDTSSRR